MHTEQSPILVFPLLGKVAEALRSGTVSQESWDKAFFFLYDSPEQVENTLVNMPEPLRARVTEIILKAARERRCLTRRQGETKKGFAFRVADFLGDRHYRILPDEIRPRRKAARANVSDGFFGLTDALRLEPDLKVVTSVRDEGE